VLSARSIGALAAVVIAAFAIAFAIGKASGGGETAAASFELPKVEGSERSASVQSLGDAAAIPALRARRPRQTDDGGDDGPSRPTSTPSPRSTQAPTRVPTQAPTKAPTQRPTSEPTAPPIIDD